MWMMCRSCLVVMVLLTGCTGEIAGVSTEPTADAGTPGAPDAAPPRPDAMDPPVVDGVAPDGEVAGERRATDGDNALTLSSTPVVFRVEAERNQHVAFVLSYSGLPGVVLTALRWDGDSAVELAKTNAGSGLRHLSVLDTAGRRTYWVRAQATESGPATLKVTRTPFLDARRCEADCARLMQMPLPNDPAVDGYDTDGGTHFRYWFGRRDLVMMVRWAARARARAGQAPFYPYDFSQWDGEIPGTDTGSLRHRSHDDGKDVDISLYGQDGLAIWRPYCTSQYTSSGRECVPGTRKNFDGRQNALMFLSHLESGRVTMSFLDRELIPAVRAAAQELVAAGEMHEAFLTLFNDGKHIQHWPNHDNHIHVRVSVEPYDAKTSWEPEFQEP
jgi:hypothetical protein